MKREFDMKKLLGVGVLSIALAGSFGLAGCGSSSGASEEEAETAQEQQVPESDYAVTIDGATLTEDYEGAPAIVVDFTWTNNSDETTSMAAALDPTVFQNGVELEMAIGSTWDSGGYLSEVKPGATTSVQLAYTLSDESAVDVEVSEMLALDDTVLASASFDPASM